jgi:hypothetical protein
LYFSFSANGFIWSSRAFGSCGNGKHSSFHLDAILLLWKEHHILSLQKSIQWTVTCILSGCAVACLFVRAACFQPRRRWKIVLFKDMSLHLQCSEGLVCFTLLWFLQALQPLLESLLRGGLERFAKLAKNTLADWNLCSQWGNWNSCLMIIDNFFRWNIFRNNMILFHWQHSSL